MKNFYQQISLLGLVLAFLLPNTIFAQDSSSKTDNTDDALSSLEISGLSFRCVGPALTSGRISDFAMNPEKPFEYYIAVSSGGVWKTENWGTTFTPIFDSQGSYSIGCVTVDPNNPNIVWVGTGENNNQRSVAYGDGVYKSIDGGSSWENMGLHNSEHIGNIVVHPNNSDIVYVAAIGPLWSKGGDRGVYKTTDGGETWEAVLTIDEHTGANEIHMDPRNPEVLYAATHQRRRHVFTYLGGGPGSAIHKSTDGGKTWAKIVKGLPTVELGRIGMAISPADPEIIYAIVEAAHGKGGLYRSTNRGASWHKRGSYSTSGNYYQEIFADPQDPDMLYAMDTWMKVSDDGGKTFRNVGEDFKHVDNHCMWINPDNTEHWLVGCDGGIYETFDRAKTWDFKGNLPITQFYKVAVDNDAPFYNIYGGTQDNFSIGGPSRTVTSHGLTNADWFITRGGDGFETQVDPKNPNIVYSQSQYGVLYRYDRLSGEEVGIQPKERKGENSYKWNWDAPLAVSHHVDGRLYFAANKLFRSDDYGNSWDVISDDLSAQIDRNKLKIMDRVWSMEGVEKNSATSPYGTIVAFSESPIDQNLLIVGTDDGLIQITEDGGESWRKVDDLDGAPVQSYVNAVYASQHDANVIYAAFNHHKYGDFKPYIFRSDNKGKSWKNISNNLPERGSVYAIEEDHENANLIFCGTEFGVFFSPNGGDQWKQLKTGVPTIAVRDLAIQRRENDLILGTFGRGFYVLDDYSPLRSISEDGIDDDAMIFGVRDGYLFEYSRPLGLPGKSFQGDSYYTAENLGSAVLISYHLAEGYKSRRDRRREQEKEELKEGKDSSYPSYDDLTAESDESDAHVLIQISNAEGKVVRKLNEKIKKGISRVKWDLRYASERPISLTGPSFYNPFARPSEGSLVEPGIYAVQLFSVIDDNISPLGDPVRFNVSPLENTVMPAENRSEKVAFQREVAQAARTLQGAQRMISEIETKMRHIRIAIRQAEVPVGGLTDDYAAIENELSDIKRLLQGDSNKRRLDIAEPPSPSSRIGRVYGEQKYSTSSPTKTHRESLAIAKEELTPIIERIKGLVQHQLSPLEQKLEDAKAPYTPGRAIKMIQNN